MFHAEGKLFRGFQNWETERGVWKSLYFAQQDVVIAIVIFNYNFELGCEFGELIRSHAYHDCTDKSG